MIFYSEYGQDRWLSEHIWPEKRNGIFVEFGALDGLLHSNTLFFERERDWNGLLIEPNPAAWSMLIKSGRRCKMLNAAIYDRHGHAQFQAIEGGLYGWSGLIDTMEVEHRAMIRENIPHMFIKVQGVPVMPLSDALIIHDMTFVDYLSIDVEGAEFSILKSFPFDKFNIDVIGVENNWKRPEIDEILLPAGYEKIARVGVDDIYRRRA